MKEIEHPGAVGAGNERQHAGIAHKGPRGDMHRIADRHAVIQPINAHIPIRIAGPVEPEDLGAAAEGQGRGVAGTQARAQEILASEA